MSQDPLSPAHPASFPLVGVITRYATGAYSVSDEGLTSCEVVPLDEALARCWDRDAHILPYQLVYATGPEEEHPYSSWPRLNKSVLEEVRTKGADVRLPLIILDWDTPGHARLTPELKDGMEASLVQAADAGLSLALSWTYLYATRNGFRLLFVLSEALSPEEYEPLYLGVVRDFLAHGIRLDANCYPWNWSFRLPRVFRELESPPMHSSEPVGEATWEADYFCFFEQPEKRLDPRSITPAAHQLLRSFSSGSTASRSGVPTPEECRAFIEHIGKSGKPNMAEWTKAARSSLRGRACFSALFEGGELAQVGTRRVKIQQVAGEMAAMLAPLPGATPESVYALADDALTRLNEKAAPGETEDFRETGWVAVSRYLAAETEKLRVEQQEQAEQQKQTIEVQATVLDQIIAGMRTWSLAPELRKSDQEAAWWVSQRVIAAWKDSCFLLKPNGYYDSVPVRASLLPARMRELGMGVLVPLEVQENGRTRSRSSQELLNAHASVVAQCDGGINIKGAHLRNEHTAETTLVLPMFSRRTDLEPVFDAEVDTWLQLFGHVEYPRLCAWIGHSLAFEDGPICALSVKGPPGCGKKMLYIGLSECIDTNLFATGAEFGPYQGLLMKTPFLVVNEGLHIPSRGSQHPSDSFRAFVSGDPIRVRELYTPPVIIRNPLRILFLANNLDVIQQLIGTRDLAPEDREALAIRIMHINAGDTAPGWLRARGGLRFTRGWIQGDDGSPSDLRVAKHFMWLFVNRPEVPAGNRLLVEGNADGALIREMATRSGSAPAVIEALIRMVESDAAVQGAIKGLFIEGSSIYVTSQGIVDFHRVHMAPITNIRMNTQTAGMVLKGLMLEGCPTHPFDVHTPTGRHRARWRQIDASTLLEEAIESGIVARRLETLALGQRDQHQRVTEMALEIQRAYDMAPGARPSGAQPPSGTSWPKSPFPSR